MCQHFGGYLDEYGSVFDDFINHQIRIVLYAELTDPLAPKTSSLRLLERL